MKMVIWIVIALICMPERVISLDDDDGYHPNVFLDRPGTTEERLTAVHEGLDDAPYWNQLGQQFLKDELNKKPLNVEAKNVILFLGDGMSMSTIASARIYKGQNSGRSGEEESLSFEKFPFTALAKTYCVDAQVADSACTATAYLSGVKTNFYTVGLDAKARNKDCSGQNDPARRVPSVMSWAQAVGKGTGIVTTTRITHATPAAAYAHAGQRNWEDDVSMMASGINPDTCDDIAEQLVLNRTGQQFKVVLGGGRAYFLPNETSDGRRLDGKNLIDQWIANNPDGAWITDRDQLFGLDLDKTGSIFGLFSSDHMEYSVNMKPNEPSLAEMTRSAIQLLQKETKGYVLLVEGGRIDQAHHEGRAKVALDETLQFDKAVEEALNMTDRSDTLIIVTADHSHTLTVSGYPVRGNDILGLTSSVAKDLKPYTTLSYANGPGHEGTFKMDGTRQDLTYVDTRSDWYRQAATVPLSSETHGGDDVAIFAIGPQAHLFQGVYEQHYIAHVIGYAACIGPGLKFCSP